MFDTLRTIETPEGVELSLRIAGPVVRSAAWTVDFLIRTVIYLGLSVAFSTLGEAGSGLLLLSVFLLEWLYPVLFEIYRDGATPGKKRLKIKVLYTSGAPISWSGSLLRNLLRAVDILPFLYGFGLLTICLNRNFQRLGDLAAGTLVVYADPLHSKVGLPDAEPLPAPYPLTSEEQRAILSFAERAQGLPPARVQELAAIAIPLTGYANPEQQLYRLAHGLYRL